MNHLAHTWLARHHDDAIVAALLSDFVKGEGDAVYPAAVRAELRLHRRVDAWTDAHPVVRVAVARFAPARRRFAGIALDVFFDHALALAWPRFEPQPLGAFGTRVCDAIDGFSAGPVPAPLAELGRRLRAHDGLAAYREFSTVGFALQRLAGRLSRGGEHLRGCEADLVTHRAALLADFDAFFPALQDWIRAERLAVAAAGPAPLSSAPSTPA